LKDTDCLVPCDGLYADIVDDSPIQRMKQNMVEGFKSLSKGMDKSNSRLLDKLHESADYRTRLNLETLSEEWSQDNKNLQATFLQMFPNTWEDDGTFDDVMKLTKAYHNYKKEYVKHLSFAPNEGNMTTLLEHAPLEAVYIYFDTATYDEIERDEKVTMEAQLGLIGGTMGLLTGFSILSGVEIIYYLFRLFLSLKFPSVEDLMSSVNKRLEKN